MAKNKDEELKAILVQIHKILAHLASGSAVYNEDLVCSVNYLLELIRKC